MGRIRTIKPELLTDAKAIGLSDMSWRLWVSTWLLADDLGRFPADTIVLLGQIFPGRTSTTVEKSIQEISKLGLVDLYFVNGQRFGKICGWDRHQKINRPSGPKFPAPCEGFSESSVSTHGALNADHDHDHDQRPTTATTTAAPPGLREARVVCERVVEKFNSNLGKQCRASAWVDAVDRALKAGHSEHDMYAAIYYATDWEAKVLARTTPSTLLRVKPPKPGKHTLPEWADLGRAAWREANGNESYPWEQRLQLVAGGEE